MWKSLEIKQLSQCSCVCVCVCVCILYIISKMNQKMLLAIIKNELKSLQLHSLEVTNMEKLFCNYNL